MTTQNKNELVVPLKELLGKKFWIPSYQRGYRWTKDHVDALLNDIWDFIKKKDKSENEFYCLQPLVVKKMSIEDLTITNLTDGDWYEVLDGQQRLTTILLILKHLSKFIEVDVKDYIIKYETRTDSEIFLSNIELLKSVDDSNIDYYHISTAFLAIKEWFKEKAITETAPSTEFSPIFFSKVKVIWYPVAESEDQIDAFTRLNTGKIKLTDAELIKSLFLNSSNYTTLDADAIRLKQLEIAHEWDRIEYTLQNNEFWGFIDSGQNYSTRIEYIFDLIAKRKEKNDKQYLTFLYFQKLFKDNIVDAKFIDDKWREIKRYFQAFEDWHDSNNYVYYHKIGFLVYFGVSLIEIKELWDKNSKVGFEKELNVLIKKCLGTKCLDDITYSDKKEKINPYLLLFNIETILQTTQSSYRFPFDKFKEERWNIEHIDSNTLNDMKVLSDQIKWLQIALLDIIKDDDLELRVNKYIGENKTDQDKFNVLRKEISALEAGDSYDNSNDLSKQSIANLCLLDESTNKSYGNALFVTKRRIIAEKIKRGTFVPLCTQNVFLKLYAKESLSLLKWGEQDREEYFNEMKNILKQYI